MVNDVAKPHKDTKAVFVDLYRFQYIVIKEMSEYTVLQPRCED